MQLSTNTGLHTARPGQAPWSPAETIAFLKAAGFEALDYSFFAESNPNNPGYSGLFRTDWRSKIDAIAQAAHEAGLPIVLSHTCYHLTLPQAHPQHAHFKTIRLAAIEAAARLGAPWTVIHPCALDGQTQVPETIEQLKPYADFAAKQGIGLAVENLRHTSAEQLMTIADALDCGVCWDTGHAHLGGFDQHASLCALAPRLKALHIHDNDGASDQHLPPFYGSIDWHTVMRGLRECGYTGAFNLEVSARTLPEAAREAHAALLVTLARSLMAGD